MSTGKQASADEQVSKAIAEGERAPRYKEQKKEPSAAETAFERPTGDLKEPVLQEDWNPAERNSDDLSR